MDAHASRPQSRAFERLTTPPDLTKEEDNHGNVSRHNSDGWFQLCAPWLGALQRANFVDSAEQRAVLTTGHDLRRGRRIDFRSSESAKQSTDSSGAGYRFKSLYYR